MCTSSKLSLVKDLYWLHLRHKIELELNSTNRRIKDVDGWYRWIHRPFNPCTSEIFRKSFSRLTINIDQKKLPSFTIILEKVTLKMILSGPLVLLLLGKKTRIEKVSKPMSMYQVYFQRLMIFRIDDNCTCISRRKDSHSEIYRSQFVSLHNWKHCRLHWDGTN